MLEQIANARRFVWNWGLERRLAHHREFGVNMTWKQLSRELTQLKATPEGAWLRTADSQALQQALGDLYRAFRLFFEGHSALPRFKSRKTDVARFRIPQRVRVAGDRVRVPKVGSVRVRITQPILGEPGGATFKRDHAGRWFVCLVCRFRAEPKPPTSKAVGIDLGIRRLATLSNGGFLVNNREHARAERRLRRAHRQLARKQPGSRNRARHRLRLAAIHAKAAGRRRDRLHKLTTGLVDEYGVICLEDLCVRGLARTKLSKSVHDAAFGEIRRQLTYKSQWAGRSLILVDRYYPSSKTCSHCGHITNDLRSDAYAWTCGRCGTEHDRDLNAARNILRAGLAQHAAAGHADAKHACGVGVRPRSEALGTEAGTRLRDAKSEVSA